MTGWRIGTIAGTPLFVARSWPIGVLALGALYLSGLVSTMPLAQAVGYAAVAVLGLFGSVLVHEVSHGLAGKALQRPPEAYTLTLWGGHTTFRGPERRPLDMALIAAAGPLANLLLALLLYSLLLLVGGERFWLVAPLVWMNVALGVFNLLPGLPMDGGHLVHALGWAVTGRRDSGMMLAGRLGQGLALAVAGYGFFPLLREEGSPNLWAVLIGMFLWQGATQAVRIAQARATAEWVDLRQWMTPVATVESNARVGDVPPGGAVVVDAGRPVAVAVPRAGIDPHLPVTAVARILPPEAVLRVPGGIEAMAALSRAAEHSDLVVLLDGERLWIGRAADLAQHLKR